MRELSESLPKDWLWVLEEIKDLLTELPPEGSQRLFELWKQVPERRATRRGTLSALDQLRLLLIRLLVPSLTREASVGIIIGSLTGTGMCPGPIIQPSKSSGG